MVAKNEKLME